MTRIDWRALLDGRTDGFGTAVGGVRVGDRLDALPEPLITLIEPAVVPVGRTWKSGTYHETTADGREALVPREVLLAELREHGGRAYVERVTFVVTEGRIRKIWIRGAPLTSLPFKAEVDIERALGPSSGIERTLGWVVHHFAKRGISVAWDVKAACVEHVALGPVDFATPTFGPKEVLREWLGAASAGLEPDWNEPSDRGSSLWARYARVTALLRAFDLGAPRSFADGKFLEGRSVASYPRVAEALAKGPWCRGGRELSPYQDALSRFFWWLLVYRMEAERLLRVNSGWLEAGHPGIFTALHVTGLANEQVAVALGEVEALLVEMIAPSGKRVTERELIARWDFPEVDLHALIRDEL